MSLKQKSEENGRIIMSARHRPKSACCARCGAELSKENTGFYLDSGYRKALIKGIGCNICLQTKKQ